MPTLPTIADRGQAARMRPAQIGPGAGAYIGKGLEQLSETGMQIIAGAEAAEKTKLIGEASAGFNRVIQQKALELTNPDEFKDAVNQAIAETYDNALNSASSNRVKRIVEAELANNLEDARRKAELGYFQKQKDKGIGDYVQARESLLQAASTADDNDLPGVYRMYGDLLGNLRATNYIDSEQMQNEIAAFPQKVELNRGYNMIEAAPQRLIDSLAAGGFSHLTGAQREALKNHAEAALVERKRVAREAEVQRVEAINSDMLERNVAGKLTIGEVMNSALPFQQKKFWVDRLDDQKKQDNKEKDPFEKSDGQTRAMVLSGVLTNPGQWSTEKILGYMGRGLSVTHANQLVNMHKELTKDKDGAPRKYDPLNRTLDTLDGLRRSYAFTKEGLDDKVTDANAGAQLRLKNDEEYQKVVDRVIQRAQAGEDPREALKQEMQPYFEQKTKGWFDRLSNWFSSPLESSDKAIPKPNLATAETIQTPSGPIRLDKNLGPKEREDIIKKMGGQVDDLDQRAREFLQHHGKAINPDTIKRTKEYLSRKRPGY